MSKDSQQLVDAWCDDPGRPVLIIDEIRFPARPESSSIGVTLVFVVVCLRARQVADFIADIADCRAGFDSQKRGHVLKARKVFGKERNGDESVRTVVRRALGSAEQVQFFIMGSNYLRSVANLASSPAWTVGTSHVDGPELRPLQLVMKVAANDWKLRNERVDVVVDRSEQLGLSLGARRKSGQAIFESFVVMNSGMNHRADGGPAQVMSPAQFTIVAVGEETPSLGDVVFLADSAAYLMRDGIRPLLDDPRLETDLVAYEPVSGVFVSLLP